MEQVQLERLSVYPIKSLDAASVSTARLIENGALEWDRRYAILDAAGEYVNGKREQRIHRIRTDYDLERATVTIRENGGRRERTYHLDADRSALESWLAEFFGYEVQVVRNDEGGYPDDTDASGPTVISTATLEAVALWFEEIDTVEMRRRLRSNVELDVPNPFWEDRLYGPPGETVGFDIGSVTFHGNNPCQRCVVPTRDPDTGEQTAGFRETFIENRERTLPSWANTDWFDHYFRLMVNTHIPESEWGKQLAIGDQVAVGAERYPEN
ncbi:MOSC domain-containing protein [Natronosalvus vescus]|uniref:MOSC domain-containing protein n=1 Tax=Natronosalvus vescus TaxID=2953881 RepID=UPI0020903C7C|nr:MOSC N-terminal beta barrel domain-containing protein [Natronosalvus vescus]